MYNALEGTKSKLDTTNKGVFFFPVGYISQCGEYSK